MAMWIQYRAKETSQRGVYAEKTATFDMCGSVIEGFLRNRKHGVAELQESGTSRGGSSRGRRGDEHWLFPKKPRNELQQVIIAQYSGTARGLHMRFSDSAKPRHPYRHRIGLGLRSYSSAEAMFSRLSANCDNRIVVFRGTNARSALCASGPPGNQAYRQASLWSAWSLNHGRIRRYTEGFPDGLDCQPSIAG